MNIYNDEGKKIRTPKEIKNKKTSAEPYKTKNDLGVAVEKTSKNKNEVNKENVKSFNKFHKKEQSAHKIGVNISPNKKKETEVGDYVNSMKFVNSETLVNNKIIKKSNSEIYNSSKSDLNKKITEKKDLQKTNETIKQNEEFKNFLTEANLPKFETPLSEAEIEARRLARQLKKERKKEEKKWKREQEALSQIEQKRQSSKLTFISADEFNKISNIPKQYNLHDSATSLARKSRRFSPIRQSNPQPKSFNNASFTSANFPQLSQTSADASTANDSPINLPKNSNVESNNVKINSKKKHQSIPVNLDKRNKVKIIQRPKEVMKKTKKLSENTQNISSLVNSLKKNENAQVQLKKKVKCSDKIVFNILDYVKVNKKSPQKNILKCESPENFQIKSPTKSEIGSPVKKSHVVVKQVLYKGKRSEFKKTKVSVLRKQIRRYKAEQAEMFLTFLTNAARKEKSKSQVQTDKSLLAPSYKNEIEKDPLSPTIKDEKPTSSSLTSDELKKQAFCDELLNEMGLLSDSIHNSKFREYCHHDVNEEINAQLRKFIDTLVLIQRRLFKHDKIKARKFLRYYMGMKECVKNMSEATVIIMAPSLQKGCVDEEVKKVLSAAVFHQVPVVFGLSRCHIGKLCKVQRPVSAFCVVMVEGAQNIFRKLMRLIPKAEKQYEDRVNEGKVKQLSEEDRRDMTQFENDETKQRLENENIKTENVDFKNIKTEKMVDFENIKTEKIVDFGNIKIENVKSKNIKIKKVINSVNIKTENEVKSEEMLEDLTPTIQETNQSIDTNDNIGQCDDDNQDLETELRKSSRSRRRPNYLNEYA